MKKNILFVVAMLFYTIAFAQRYQISAHVTGFKNGTKFYLNNTELDTNIDSAIISNDKFVMKGYLPKTPQNLWVTASMPNKFYFFTLLIGNEHITVNGDATAFPYDLAIKGSKTQNEHDELINLIKGSFKQRNQLVENYQSLSGNPDSIKKKSKAIWANIKVLDNERDAATKQFVKTHLNTYEGLYNLFYLKDKLSKDSIQLLYNQINPTFKQTEFAVRVATYLKVGKILEEGDKATDFTAFDVNNKNHSLSDIKGKYVLLDFSSTYCGPCIESLDELQKVSDKFKNNLSVITVSGDAGRATWLTGYKRDKPTWLSLWDGQGYHSEISIKYGVSGYPSFVLIDPNGKILSMWSGYGKPTKGPGNIEMKLDKLLAVK